jgi:hypothetical protein
MASDEVFADCNGAKGEPAPVADPAELDADERAMVEGPVTHFDAFLLDTEGSASRPVCDGKVGPSDSLTVFRHNFLAAPNRCAACVKALEGRS